MRHFDVNWIDVISAVPAWESLPMPTRLFFLTDREPYGTSEAKLGGHLEPLERSGFLARLLNNPRRLKLADNLKPFRRVMRAMFRQPVFDSPGDDRKLIAYLQENFTNNECYAFLGGEGYYFASSHQGLSERVSSPSWLESFLALKSMNDAREFEKHHGAVWYGDGALLGRLDILQAAQKFIRGLKERTEPVPLAQLRAVFPDLAETQLQAALAAGIRYLMVFPALRGSSLEPVVGLWPTVSRRLHRPAARLPEPVTPEVSLRLPYLIEDMVVLLAMCTAEPVRLRASDNALFARAQGELEARLVELPDWHVAVFPTTLEQRVGAARLRAQELGLLITRGREGRSLRLEPTAQGLRWLGQNARDRAKAILDAFRAAANRRHGRRGSNGVDFLPRLSGYALDDNMIRCQVDGLKEGFGCLEEDVFVPSHSFAQYLAECKNPLVEWLLQHKSQSQLWAVLYNRYYGYGFQYRTAGPPRESLERNWSETVISFLLERLAPFGGASLGVSTTRQACFAITDMGRYLLGLADDFELATRDEAEIVVQPNFDVVFLAPSPVLEVSIGRMADRVGKGVGVLFRITKKSIFAAAATGMTAAEAIGTLQESSTRDLPANVEREIRGWFGQCRRVTMRQSILIHCPDAETAGRVRGAGGKKITPITDTVLEFHDAKQRAPFLRKLRDLGVFVGPEADD